MDDHRKARADKSSALKIGPTHPVVAMKAEDLGDQSFGVIREKRGVQHDADRLPKYLARFGLDWRGVK